MIDLGDEVQDVVTGFVGVAVARHDYLNGCSRFSVQPKVGKDGKVPEAVTFDEPQLKVTKAKKVPLGSRITGGPEKYMPAIRREG